jgi:ABC-type Zn uptake system ZnuABC Zn-binding protein ZnuA
MALLLAIGGLALSGCGSDNAGTPPKVVASNSQLADLVRQIGGSAASVTELAPAEVNPHTWMPPSDAAATLGAAAAVFHAGGQLEPWFDPLIKQAGSSADEVDLSKSAKLIGSGSDANDHWVTDIYNAKLAAKTVAATLTKLNPDAKETYAANLKAFTAAADKTDDELNYCSSLIDSSEQRVVAGHDDLAYLSKRYNFKVVAQIVNSGADAPTAHDQKRALREARRGRAKAVVPSWSEVDVEAGMIAQQLGVTKASVFSDSVSKLNPAAATLLGSITYTVKAIVAAVSRGKANC